LLKIRFRKIPKDGKFIRRNIFKKYYQQVEIVAVKKY